MKSKYMPITGLLAILLLTASSCFATNGAQVLVTIGDKLEVTSDELEKAIASTPTKFASMDEDDQAALRGNMLKHLVTSKLLTLEARRLGLDTSQAYLDELEGFRLGLLYRFYMNKLKQSVQVPDDVLAEMKKQYEKDREGLDAVKAAYVTDRYRNLRYLTIQNLRDKYHIRIFEDRIQPGKMTDDTILLKGDGIQITYGGLVKHLEKPPSNMEWIKDELYKRAELLTIAKAAANEGVDVSDSLQAYADDRLPAILMEQKQREWTSDESKLHAFFDANPQIGRVKERRHIGQLVTATREEAESLRQRILKGESLYTLAAKYSIDPYGKEHSGDMGWHKEGSGYPAIEETLNGLKNEQISEVVQTPKGFHLVEILERRPGGQKRYSAVRDKVRQIIITEKLAEYINELSERYPVDWKLVDNANKKK